MSKTQERLPGATGAQGRAPFQGRALTGREAFLRSGAKPGHYANMNSATLNGNVLQKGALPVLNGKTGSSNTLTTLNFGPQRITKVSSQDLDGYLYLLILKYHSLFDSLYFLNNTQQKDKDQVTYLKRLGNKLVVEEIGKYLVNPLFANDRASLSLKPNEDCLNESIHYYKNEKVDLDFPTSDFSRGERNFWSGSRILDLVNILRTKILKSKKNQDSSTTSSVASAQNDNSLRFDLKTLERKAVKFLSSYYFANYPPLSEKSESLERSDDVTMRSQDDQRVKVQIIAIRNKGVKAFNEDYYTIIQDYGELLGMDESKAVISKKALFLGLYDGHMGKQASEYSASHLHYYISQGIKEQGDLKEGIKTGFCRTDERFNYPAEKYAIKDGTTCIACFLQFYDKKDAGVGPSMIGKLTIANCGDSKAVLCMRRGKTKIVNLTEDHRLDREDERKRVEAAGATIMKIGVLRINGELSITRSIGDRTLKKYVIADPEIKEVEIDQDCYFLILATDGLWDVMKVEQAVEFVEEHIKTKDRKEVAAALVEEAIKTRSSRDNVTVIVLFFDFIPNC